VTSLFVTHFLEEGHGTVARGVRGERGLKARGAARARAHVKNAGNAVVGQGGLE